MKFYETETYKIKKNEIYQLQVIPRRLMGKISPIDIQAKGEIVVKQGDRISARHIRKIESARLKNLDLPKEALYGQVLAKDLLDKSTGEIVLESNTQIDEEILPIIEAEGYYINLEDNRPPLNLQFKEIDQNYLADKNWPMGHPAQGQPIVLRDYQIEVINKFLHAPQSIQEIATGAGKTIITATLSKLCEPYGRTVVIVTNKSLVTQTEEDYKNAILGTGFEVIKVVSVDKIVNDAEEARKLVD